MCVIIPLLRLIRLRDCSFFYPAFQCVHYEQLLTRLPFEMVRPRVDDDS